MKCEKCGNSNFERPQEKSASEIWQCKECGNQVAVRCHYIPDLSDIPMRDLFMGTAFINSEADALKSLLKLKKVLAFAERFDSFEIDEQYKAGKLTWNLGFFLDFELARAEADCSRIGIVATFCKVG